MNNSILSPQLNEIRLQRQLYEEKLNLFGITIGIYRNTKPAVNSFDEPIEVSLQLKGYYKIIRDDETDIRYLKKLGWLIDQHPNTEFLLLQTAWDTDIQKGDILKVPFNVNSDGFNGGQDNNWLEVSKIKGINLYQDIIYILLQAVPYHGKEV